jgi:Protein of unknown function (DUF1573)
MKKGFLLIICGISMVNAVSAQSPAPVTAAQSPAPVTTAQSPAPLTGAQSPAPVKGAQSPAPITGGQSPAPITGGQSPAPLTPFPKAIAKTDNLLLKETSYSFGKIPQGRAVMHIFEIVNTGKEPLMLENVQASCGCTTPEWSREAIPPGGSSPLKVGYNAYADGHFNKTVTIFYNNGQTKALIISGEVYKLPASAAPENASVQFLKQTNQ